MQIRNDIASIIDKVLNSLSYKC